MVGSGEDVGEKEVGGSGTAVIGGSGPGQRKLGVLMSLRSLRRWRSPRQVVKLRPGRAVLLMNIKIFFLSSRRILPCAFLIQPSLHEVMFLFHRFQANSAMAGFFMAAAEERKVMKDARIALEEKDALDELEAKNDVARTDLRRVAEREKSMETKLGEASWNLPKLQDSHFNIEAKCSILEKRLKEAEEKLANAEEKLAEVRPKEDILKEFRASTVYEDELSGKAAERILITFTVAKDFFKANPDGGWDDFIPVYLEANAEAIDEAEEETEVPEPEADKSLNTPSNPEMPPPPPPGAQDLNPHPQLIHELYDVLDNFYL